MSPTLQVSYARGNVFGAAGKVLARCAGRSGSSAVAWLEASSPDLALKVGCFGEFALRLAELGLPCVVWVRRTLASWRGRASGVSTGTGIWVGGFGFGGPLAVLLSSAAFCVRGGFEGDAIKPDAALLAAEGAANVGDCFVLEFCRLRGRGRLGEPWKED